MLALRLFVARAPNKRGGAGFVRKKFGDGDGWGWMGMGEDIYPGPRPSSSSQAGTASNRPLMDFMGFCDFWDLSLPKSHSFLFLYFSKGHDPNLVGARENLCPHSDDYQPPLADKDNGKDKDMLDVGLSLNSKGKFEQMFDYVCIW